MQLRCADLIVKSMLIHTALSWVNACKQISAMNIINSFSNECILSKKKQSTELRWKFTFEVTLWNSKLSTIAFCGLEKTLESCSVKVEGRVGVEGHD